MLKHLFNVLKSYHSLRSRQALKEESLAWRCMTTNMSYRLGQDAEKQPSIGLRLVWRTWRQMNAPTTCIKTLEAGAGFAIFDGDFRYQQLEYEYVKKQSSEAVTHFISKTNLPSGFKGKIVPQAVWLFFSLGSIVRCAVSRKSRIQFALHPVFIAELTVLSHLIEQTQIKGLYDFSPYFIDSNWAYVFLKGKIARYAKLPSPGPLKTHNSITLCDSLIISSGYHEEELPHLPDVNYTSLEKWLPEWAFTYIDRYLSNSYATPKATIGFYSHGSWVRKKEGHSDDNLHIDQSEEALLTDLNLFLETYPEYSLTVFLHPRERNLEVALCKAHYAKYIRAENVKFFDLGVSSTQSFEQVDIGVAAFSTILYERLFCGFKTLIGNYYTPEFPLAESALEPICFNDRQRLFDALLNYSAVSREDFFQQPGMNRYHFSSYPYFAGYDRDH